MTKKKQPRKQYVVNKKLQWRIAWQVIVTWVVGASVALLFPILALFICGVGFAGMTFDAVFASVSQAYTFPVLMAIVFMPLAIWHSFQFSNRIAGPMFRFQREIKTLLEGNSIDPIKLRPNDYWPEFAELFNELAEKMGKLNSEAGTPAESESEAKDDEPKKEDTKKELVGV